MTGTSEHLTPKEYLRLAAPLSEAHSDPDSNWVRLFLNQKKIIIGSLILSMSIAALYVHFTPKWYTASGLILLREIRSGSSTGLRAQTDNLTNTTFVENQIEILRSDRTLARANNTTPFKSDAELPQNVSWLLSFILPSEDRKPEPAVRDVLDRFRKSLTVRRVGLSQVAQVMFRTNDRERSSQIVNVVMRSFIIEQQEMSAEENQREAASVRKAAEALRAEAFEAEKAVQTFRAEMSSLEPAQRAAPPPFGSNNYSGETPRNSDLNRSSRMRDAIESQARLRELESVARSTRAAYEEVMRHAIESAHLATVTGQGAVIVAPAVPPSRHSSPRLFPAVVIALLAGVTSGCVLAFVRLKFATPSH